MIAIVAFIVPVFVGIFEELAEELRRRGRTAAHDPDHVGVSDAVTGYWYIVIPGDRADVFAFVRWKKTERGRAQSGPRSS